jgi:regulator of RNase E activity RraA
MLPMSTAPTPKELEFLHSLDTPTVCNLIEIAAPERRGSGYTIKHLHCPFPELPVMVGFAKTVTIRAKDAIAAGDASYMQKRLEYLDYVAAEPRPSIVVIEDLDGEHAGYGAFWGEVQSNVHKALGCLGTVTNGSIRDIPMIPEGFQMLAGSISPSHAYVHVVEFGGAVNVHGMATKSGDLVHADRHGAVVVPIEKISAMMAAADALTKREARIIAAARAANASVESIKAAMRG